MVIEIMYLFYNQILFMKMLIRLRIFIDFRLFNFIKKLELKFDKIDKVNFLNN